MIRIGLTGGIATGKSTVAAMLRALGAGVIDADEIARALTGEGGAAAAAVATRFGTLDRRALAKRVFADPAELAALNAIVHPLVADEIERRTHDAASPVVVVDVPLLFESGMEHTVDEVWVTNTPRPTQMERAMARGLTAAEAAARIDSQMSADEKLRRADVVIDTSGTPEQTRPRVEALYRDALRRAGDSQ